MVKTLISNPTCKFAIAVVLFLGIFIRPVAGDPTFAGPSGFVTVPSGETIRHGQVEFGTHTRLYHVGDTNEERLLSYLTLGFSPVRDVEIGVQKRADSRMGSENTDPSPTVNFKVRLPPVGGGDFSRAALGMVLDTDPNNYHTLYFTIGGAGIGYNFGGNPGSGEANFGAWDKGKKEPRSLCVLLGGEIDPRKPGERGYRHHYLFDYNGDIFSAVWRYKSHRGFWVDGGLHTQTSYSHRYNFLPVSIGVGGIF